MTLDRLTTQLFITILGAVAVEPVGFMQGGRHMKVYIAGAITDNPNHREQFKEAEERLVAAGHAVINPCKNEGFTYREYINMGLCELMHCDAIYLLKGYENSTGATLEHDYARTVGLEIMYQKDEKPIKEVKLYQELSLWQRTMQTAKMLKHGVYHLGKDAVMTLGICYDWNNTLYYDNTPTVEVSSGCVYIDVKIDDKKETILMTAEQAKAVIKALKIQLKRLRA